MLDGIYTNTAILWLLLEVIPGIKIDIRQLRRNKGIDDEFYCISLQVFLSINLFKLQINCRHNTEDVLAIRYRSPRHKNRIYLLPQPLFE